MAKIISVGIQKGGVGKSTTASVLAYHLSQEHKVLAVDMDGQGNFTQLLTGSDNIFEFQGTTVWNAITEQNASDYILEINPNLHIISGDEDVNTLGSFFYVQLKGDFHFTLKKALDKVADNYDYIIIDNPPALGELSILSLTASDYVLIMFETSQFCYNSLGRYFNTISKVKEAVNPNLEIIGIVRNMIDGRRKDSKYYSDLVEKEYSKYCLKTVLNRSAYIGRLPLFGIKDNPDMKEILKIYNPLLMEVMDYVN